MPSSSEELQRLHPASLVFTVGAAAKGLLLPGMAVLFASRGSNYEIWLMAMFVPAVIAALVKYFTYTYRLGSEEMVIREGVLTRNERHIPYGRVQNIDLIQNPFHRLVAGSGPEVLETSCEVVGAAGEFAPAHHLLAMDQSRCVCGQHLSTPVEQVSEVPVQLGRVRSAHGCCVSRALAKAPPAKSITKTHRRVPTAGRCME